MSHHNLKLMEHRRLLFFLTLPSEIFETMIKPSFDPLKIQDGILRHTERNYP